MKKSLGSLLCVTHSCGFYFSVRFASLADVDKLTVCVRAEGKRVILPSNFRLPFGLKLHIKTNSIFH